MALTAVVEKLLSVEDATIATTHQGVVRCTDGSLLFGFCTDSDPGVTNWYRSTDGGSTWSPYSTTTGSNNFDQSWPSHTPNNRIVFPRNDYYFTQTDLMLSDNGGSSWASAAHFESGGEPTARSVWSVATVAYDKGKYIAGGQFAPSTDGPAHYLAKSTDNGETWSSYTGFSAADEGSYCSALCNVGDGLMFAAFRKWDSGHGRAEIYKSTDYGDTWTLTGSLPMPSGSDGSAIADITALSDTDLVAVGTGADATSTARSYVFYSHDAGDTWHRVAESDISIWEPASEGFQGVWFAKRLTRDAVIISVENYAGTAKPLWVISQDRGETYELEPSFPAGAWPAYGACQGAASMSPDGTLYLPAWTSDDFSVIYQEVYRMRLTC